MNVAIVVPYFTPYVRGNEYGLAQSLIELGHNVTIITTTSRAPREKSVIKEDTKTEGQQFEFDVEYTDTLIDLGDNPITRGISKNIREQDYIMLQEDYPIICHNAYYAAKNHNIPIILSSERTYYPENIAKRTALKLMDATLNKRLRNNVDRLTAHCTAAKEFMVGELGVKRDIPVIPVGVDSQLFKPLNSSGKYLLKGDVKILVAARLHSYKGLNYLIESMKTVHEEMPNVHLYILGNGPEESNLKYLTKKLNLNDVVTFLTAPIPNYEMPLLYNECDIYVQPSIIEPYGIAVLEAMSCGKPVIGTNVGGMRDTISDEVTGYLVPPGNSAKLGEKIIHLASNKSRYIKMGNAARNRASNLFDLKIIGRKYMDLFKSLV